MSSAEESWDPHGDGKLWIDAGVGFAVAILVAIVLKTFVIAAVHVPSRSMERTLLPGDYVLVNRLGRSADLVLVNPLFGLQTHVVRTPQVRRTRIGDIVLVRPPASALQGDRSGDLFFIKRCIAVGGDSVEFHGGVVTVNRKPLLLPETALARDNPDAAFPAWKAGSVVVPEGQVFLLGDNASDSYDSRIWGCIPESHIIGNAVVIYWSMTPPRSSIEEHEGAGTVRWNRIGTLLR